MALATPAWPMEADGATSYSSSSVIRLGAIDSDARIRHDCHRRLLPDPSESATTALGGGRRRGTIPSRLDGASIALTRGAALYRQCTPGNGRPTIFAGMY